MLKSSEFNSAVPKFTNGNYASNPIDPTNIEEPSAQDYVRGAEPLDTLPAQWWNWLCNQFTSRFNKLNTYVKNIFDELTGFLSLLNITPDGTESAITTGQLKNAFKEDYPTYVSNKLELGTTYVKQTTTVNGHALSGNVTVSKSDVGLGNVPNVSTNDQTPTYTEASTLTALSSGEKLSIAFGKLAKAVSSLISHINNTNNPHSVTKAQVQLGDVVNTGDSATPVENGTTKFTTGGAFTELGKKLNGISARYTVSQGSVPTNKYILIFERTAPVSYFGLAFHIFGQFGQISSLDKQTFEILIDFRNASSSVDFHAITDRAYNNFDVIATWDNNTNTARVYLEIKQGYASANINAIEGDLKLPFTAYSSMLGTPSGYTFLSQATIVQTNVKNSLASNFSPTRAYAVGDYVLYDSLFYKCTTAHSAGSWNSSHFTAVTVGEAKQDKLTFDTLPILNSNNPVTSGGLFNNKYRYAQTKELSNAGWYKIAEFGARNLGASIRLELATSFTNHANSSHIIDINFGWSAVSVTDIAQDPALVFSKIKLCRNDNNADRLGLYVYYSVNAANTCFFNIAGLMEANVSLYNFEQDELTWELTNEFELHYNGIWHNGIRLLATDTISASNAQALSSNGAYNLLTSLAPIFSTATSYAVGDMVTYNGRLYTCTTAHSAGAWNASHFTVCNLNTELAKKLNVSSAGDQVTYSLSGNTLTITSLS